MELNREDVIEALKCCSKGTATACYDCPYHKDDDFFNSYENLVKCMEKRMRDAVAVIEELTEESQKWEQAYDCSDSACRELSSKCDELTEENERLRAERDTLDILVKDLRFRNKELQRYNEGLAKNIEELEIENDKVREAYSVALTQVRADTVREMEKRLKVAGYGIFADDNTFDGYVVDYDDIDEITKEMLEETK